MTIVDWITEGDVAILRFLAAAELIETDLWQQYTELAGADAPESSYRAAIEVLDEDMPQYISDNTDDEISHAAFLNAYLASKGAQPVNLDRVPDAAEQSSNGRATDRTTDQSHAAHRGYELVDPVPQHDESRPRRDVSAGDTEPRRGPAPGDSPQRCRAW